MTTNYESYLKTSLAKYKYADIAKRDVLNVFQQFKDLRPAYNPYIFNDGSKKELLNLDGTIPVSYRSVTYNIPVCIWILDTHPYNPPMVFVKPTTSMQIKQGRNVDANGKVDLPYLRDWRYPQSDLLGLIQILVIVFSDDPPVFSRGQAQAQRQQQQYSQQQPSNLPYPSQGGFQMPTPGGTTANPPAYSQYPSGGYNQAGSRPEYNYGGNYPQQGFPAYPPSTGSYPQSGQQQYPSQTPYPGYPQSQYPTSTASTVTSSSQSGPGNTNTVTEEHLRMSLLSAVEDKMKRRLREIFEQAQAEMNVLHKTQTDLLQGRDKLDKMMKDLDTEKNDIENNIQMLKEKDSEVKNALDKMGKQGGLNIDDAVVTTMPLYKQLVNSFAEEQAIEDALFYLGDALRKDVIDIDVFLKQVRELSRRQFMLRALITKCRDKAGLSPLA
ncbi:tumor susceptibility gene 101 protein-like [Mizuhopecten yessoensis]|uniref:Tumor susceptibility protein 101 n=1 Tax=Mizuhopecten yessoensis TaxID=6573 RepID=A0A210QTE9_MIZYE|nr:tumor susceptibility gene 101 protein-like [Mizuhopecten yessoensis]OWF51987.1 Tumor susceptibility protein 101 [Mizuhopecten yessoensis]